MTVVHLYRGYSSNSATFANPTVLLHLSQPIYLAQVSAIFKEFPNLCADFFRYCLRLLVHWTENGDWDFVSLVLLTLGRDKLVTES